MHETENSFYDPSQKYDYRVRDPPSLKDSTHEVIGQISGCNTEGYGCNLATDGKCREKMLDWAFEVRFAVRDISANCISSYFDATRSPNGLSP